MTACLNKTGWLYGSPLCHWGLQHSFEISRVCLYTRSHFCNYFNSHSLISCQKTKKKERKKERKTSPSPLNAIFGLTQENIPITTHQRKALAFSSLFIFIYLYWKSAVAPTHTHLINIMSNLKLEKIRYTVTSALQNFHRTWDTFIKFIKQLDRQQLNWHPA